jgi:ribonuclease BN (tRNA processing enzyme)
MQEPAGEIRAMASLTVLGTASGAPVAHSACSSYLVAHGGAAILLDCGPGTLGRLQAEGGVRAIDAVFITHMHSDHFLDLAPLNIALLSEPASGQRRRLPVYLPPGGLETLAATFHALTVNVTGTLAGRYTEALDCREYQPGERIDSGPLVTTIVGPLRHATLAFGLRVQAGDGVLGYTGDTAPCDAAVAVGQDVALFLAECTYPEPGINPAALHTSAPELGALAARANPRRLIATHFAYARWPADAAAREAAVRGGIRAGGFTGDIAIAADGCRFEF